MTQIIIKVQCEEKADSSFARFCLQEKDYQQGFQLLSNFVTKAFQLQDYNHQLTYIDDEDDSCLVTTHNELETAIELCLALKKQSLKLTVKILGKKEKVINTQPVDMESIMLQTFPPRAVSASLTQPIADLPAQPAAVTVVSKPAQDEKVHPVNVSSSSVQSEPLEQKKKEVKEEVKTELVHSGITCSGCGISPIKGPRYSCQICPDADLCSACERDETKRILGHSKDHPVYKIRVNTSSTNTKTAESCSGKSGCGMELTEWSQYRQAIPACLQVALTLFMLTIMISRTSGLFGDLMYICLAGYWLRSFYLYKKLSQAEDGAHKARLKLHVKHRQLFFLKMLLLVWCLYYPICVPAIGLAFILKQKQKQILNILDQNQVASKKYSSTTGATGSGSGADLNAGGLSADDKLNHHGTHGYGFFPIRSKSGIFSSPVNGARTGGLYLRDRKRIVPQGQALLRRVFFY